MNVGSVHLAPGNRRHDQPETEIPTSTFRFDMSLVAQKHPERTHLLGGALLGAVQ
jgi:hypothetical protein